MYEIKKELDNKKYKIINDLNVEGIVIDYDDVMDILDKYDNQPDLEEDLKVALKETVTMGDLINTNKELIKKYEDKINDLNETRNMWLDKGNYSMVGSCDDKINTLYMVVQDLRGRY